MTKKELTVLKQLRQNSRKTITQISKETNIPISTLFDIIKKLESNIILKHVSLIDFSKLGYSLKVNFKINSSRKQELKEFLMKNININSLSSLLNGHGFYAECIFRDLKELNEFKEKLEKFEIDKFEEIFIIDEIKKEEFTF